jgi:TctA family transporter
MNVGVFSLSNNPWDCLILWVFGVFGYMCVTLVCAPAPLILGFILGPLLVVNLRRALLLSRGDPTVFFDPVAKPISFSFLLAALALLVVIALPNIRKKREEVFVEE